MFKKMMMALVAVMFLASPVFAGNQPEFDAVYKDNANFFVADPTYKDGILNKVGQMNIAPNSKNLNDFSRFYKKVQDPISGLFSWVEIEYFKTQAGLLFPDWCFTGYSSAMTDAWNQGLYEWNIVIQKKPESDINLNIRDCVIKHNEYNIWTGAEQTGRYRADWGQLFFVVSANPLITVIASPGPFATPGFAGPFIMDYRAMPTLAVGSLNAVLYTSKALFDEALVIVMPQTGTTNVAGAPVYNLKQGDIINVKVYIPFNNTCDVFYGPDNVILKYVGVVGQEYTGYDVPPVI